jgi:uncharacterized protein YeaO (DUF488 family)
MIKLKRIYEPYARGDGFRVLVDRLWPRGVSKAKAKADLWLKDIGPTNALRKWFAHDPRKWPAFQKKYCAELKHNPALADLKAVLKKHKIVTLLYGAKDSARNQAVVLAAVLSRKR